MISAVRKQELVSEQPRTGDPNRDSLSSVFRNLELDGLPGFLLKDGGPREDAVASGDIANSQAD